MKTSTAVLKLILILGFSMTQASHADQAVGPHGGQIVQNEAHKFEVKINPNDNNVEVYTLGKPKSVPTNMSITLFRNADTGQTVSLQAVKLKDPLPKFQGEVSLASGSYVAAELRFEISLKSFQVLKFIPYIPNLERK